ncbi:hypothetical protein HV410_14635 [Enterococcus faecium]|nr:hypothetical protein [Enterococcus faecium]
MILRAFNEILDPKSLQHTDGSIHEALKQFFRRKKSISKHLTNQIIFVYWQRILRCRAASEYGARIETYEMDLSMQDVR